MNFTNFEEHITVQEEGQTAVEVLASHTPLGRNRLKQVMANGAVWLESGKQVRRLRRAKTKLRTGDQLHIYFDENIQAQKPTPARLLKDMGEYSIWDKPAGMYSQGSKWGDHCTISRWAEQNLEPQRTAFVVHRLDRAASGLMILAHNKKTARVFSEMFRNRSMKKLYRTRVEGLLETALPATINSPIDGKDAETVIHEATLDSTSNTTELLVEIKTGRKHQIRKHMASLSHPVAGDRLYGAKDLSCDLQLTSVILEFHCPVSDEVVRYSIDPANSRTISPAGLIE